MNTGVYKITNTINNKIYVGSTANKLGFIARWKHHLSRLRKNKHCNQHLQRAFNKHGEGALIFEILETCEKDHCIPLEQKYLDSLKPYNPTIGYNICAVAGSTLGRKHSAETRAKISKNRTYGEPHNKNKQMTEEARKNMSSAQKNSTKNKEHLDLLNKSKRKPVIGTCKKTGNIIYLEHTKASDIFLSSGIVACCNGRWSSYKGYCWEYVRQSET